PIDFTDTAIGEAAAGLEKIYTSIGRVQKKIGNEKDITGEDSSDYWVRFCEAMDDDFNTAHGIGIIFNAVRDINRLLDKSEEKLSLETKKITMTAQTDIMKMCNILGILTEPPEVYFSKKRSKGLKKESLDPDEIEKMINERTEARKIKDWDKADQIRKKLEDMNIVLKDSSEGTVWEVKNA
ncbi:MAG: DALR domain-containing protein, partial [Desulfobacterales bacterium]